MFNLKKSRKKEHAQGITEFAIVLPVVLMIVFGVIEFGYLLFSYSSVNTASKDAARYGIAIGTGTGSTQRYWDCTGIMDAGMRLGSFAGMETTDFAITYDSGPGSTTKYSSCTDLAGYGGVGDGITFGDRIVVTVTHDYQPIAAMMGINIPPFTMTSTSHRTIVKNANISNNSNPGGGGGGTPPDCHTLILTHTGDGADPTVSPASSSGCSFGGYTVGESLTLSASPHFGWSVGSWVNTDNDSSLGTTNTATMPDADLTVGVNYLSTSPSCYVLTLSAGGTGTGSVPSTSPASSPWCPSGEFVEDEIVTLTASADAGNHISGWVNTLDDATTSSTNTVVMPGAAYSASVLYEVDATCYALTTSHNGSGVDPVPSAPNCAGGLYTDGSVVTLNAVADAGYEISGWSGTNDDASIASTNTVTMDTDKNAKVFYVPTVAPDPPATVYIPNDLALSEWKWQNGLQQCQQIDLRWSANASWSEVPIYYEVFRSSVNYGSVVGTHWDSDHTVDMNEQITLGVRAVFTGGIYSITQNVTYSCNDGSLDFWGSGTE